MAPTTSYLSQVEVARFRPGDVRNEIVVKVCTTARDRDTGLLVPPYLLIVRESMMGTNVVRTGGVTIPVAFLDQLLAGIFAAQDAMADASADDSDDESEGRR